MDTIDEFLQAERELDFEDISISDIGEKELKKTIKKKEDAIEISFLETEDYILEQIGTLGTLGTLRQDKEKYLKYNKKTEEIDIISQFTYKDKVFKPISNKLTKQNIILLPTGVEEYESDGKLIKEISEFMFSYFEPPTKFYESLLPYLLLFYWVSDKFPFVPYLHFVGLTGTGKTTAMEVFGSISYKAIDSSGAITPASLFRLANDWKGTLLLDEFEIGGKNGEAYTLMVQILKSGVSDKPLFRTEGEGKKQVEIYMMKSPRVFTSQNPIMDAALQSRTILVRMNKNTKRLPLYRLASFFEKANYLRNKLLLWRLRNFNKVDLSKIEYGFEELSVFDRRVQQVLTPIYYLSDKNTQKLIYNFAKEQEEITTKERQEELDGQIFLIIYENIENGVQPTLGKIAEELNKGKSTHLISEKKVSNIVRKIFNFETERVGRGDEKKTIVIVNEERFKNLCVYYGLPVLAQVSQVSQVSQMAKEIFNL